MFKLPQLPLPPLKLTSDANQKYQIEKRNIYGSLSKLVFLSISLIEAETFNVTIMKVLSYMYDLLHQMNYLLNRFTNLIFFSLFFFTKVIGETLIVVFA